VGYWVSSAFPLIAAIACGACPYNDRASAGDDASDAPPGTPDAPQVTDAPPGTPDAPEMIDAAPDARPDAAAVCSTAGLVCPGSSPIILSCGNGCWAGCTNGSPILQAAAQGACAAWGGALARIDDLAENQCVQSALGGAVWLGLVQALGEPMDDTGWSWNGDGVSPGYDNWDTGQPDDAGAPEDNEEQCAMQETPSGDWHDIACSTTLARFACRR
jgi:hypothetical protein